MADLSMEYAGMTFKNPLIAASGPNTDGVEMIKAAIDAGFAGVVLKSVGHRGAREQSMMKGVPRYKIVNRFDRSQPWTSKLGRDNMGLIIQGESLSVWAENYHEFISECKKAAGKDALIGASGQCSSRDISSYDDLVESANRGGADFIEVNIGFSRFFKDPDFAPALVRRLKTKTSLPLTVKLPPFLTDPLAAIKDLYRAGADGIHIFNNGAGFDIDIETQRPLFKGTIPSVLMPEGLTLLYTLHYLALSRLDGVDVGLSAGHGIWNWQDIIKCILCGADTVQVSRRVMVSGFKIAAQWLNGINAWLDDRGYSSLRELKSNALTNIANMADVPKEVALERGGIPSLMAVVDRDKCIECGWCEDVCFYFAMKLDEEDIAYSEPSRCTGCGQGTGGCPTEAVTLKQRTSVR